MYLLLKKGVVYVEKNGFFSKIILLSITKKYLLEQKIRLLEHSVCFPDLNPIENLY